MVQTLSSTGTSTWFGSVASEERMCPNLAHITWSAPGKFIVNEDGTTKKVLGCCTYYGNRLQVLKENLLPWSSRKGGSLSSVFYSVHSFTFEMSKARPEAEHSSVRYSSWRQEGCLAFLFAFSNRSADSNRESNINLPHWTRNWRVSMNLLRNGVNFLRVLVSISWGN